jgi:hypothetical protein
MTKRIRLFILGAGFSAPAGLPLAERLWREVLQYADHLGDHAGQFNKDLSNYIRFRKDCYGEQVEAANVNFEDFMGHLDFEHFLGLRGGDTWSDDGNVGTITTKFMIGDILAGYQNRLKKLPDIYLEFAKRLQPDDWVLTLNYDTILETALESVGKRYRLFPRRYKTVSEYYSTTDDDASEVVVLKLHGSIDWFDRSTFDRRCKSNAAKGFAEPADAIFSNSIALDLRPIVDGPRQSNDALKHVYRSHNLAHLYTRYASIITPPRLLSPSAAKFLYAKWMEEFWWGIGSAGHWNTDIAIVGYSLPEQDSYFLQVLHRIVSNYQRSNWNDETFGKKRPLAIVNLFHNKKARRQFKERFQFVDWKRASLIGTGFDTSSLEQIFG